MVIAVPEGTIALPALNCKTNTSFVLLKRAPCCPPVTPSKISVSLATPTSTVIALAPPAGTIAPVVHSKVSKIPSLSSSKSIESGTLSPSVSIPVTSSLKSTSPPVVTSFGFSVSAKSVSVSSIPLVAS